MFLSLVPGDTLHVFWGLSSPNWLKWIARYQYLWWAMHKTIHSFSQTRYYSQWRNLHDVTSEGFQLLLKVQSAYVFWGHIQNILRSKLKTTGMHSLRNEMKNAICTSIFTKVFLQDHTASGIKSICCFPQFSHSNVFLKTSNTHHLVRTALYGTVTTLTLLILKQQHSTITAARVSSGQSMHCPQWKTPTT